MNTQTQNRQQQVQINTAGLCPAPQNSSDVLKSQTKTNQKQMTKDQWNKTHADFKSIFGGQRFVLGQVRGATSFIPVEII